MKAFKRILTLTLAALLLTLIAVPAAAAELVETAEMCYSKPFVGDKASSIHPESGDPDKYLIAVHEIYYLQKDENGKLIQDSHGNYASVKLASDDVFEEGIDYRIRFEFVPKSGYELDDVKTTFIINSKVIEGNVGKLLREDAFFARPESERPSQNKDANLCPYCHEEHTGFLAFLVKFFHKILFKLGFKK